MSFKSGFIPIIGSPNVGKSTLFNALIGQKLAAVTSKQQTTRHRLQGVLNGKNYQIVFSDTPGAIRPFYKLHEMMMQSVYGSLKDADVLLLVTDIHETVLNEAVLSEKIKKLKIPLLILINKSDIAGEKAIEEKKAAFHAEFPEAEIVAASALRGHNTSRIIDGIVKLLPESPPYYPDDTLTDRSEKFFAAELIREKVLLNFHREVPYCCEVQVNEFTDKEEILHIHASVIVMRESQKAIILGHKGTAIKKLGISARKELEKFFGKKIYLELHVKVKKGWRDNEWMLKQFGY